VPDEGSPGWIVAPVRRRPDGSIDQEFYAARARQLRSAACCRLLRRLTRRLFESRRLD